MKMMQRPCSAPVFPMPFPIQPMTLSLRAEPFNHPEWLFEIKYDGFRALAYIQGSQCQLVSRRGNVYKRFLPLAEQMARDLKVRSAVLDGEIVCLDTDGRSHFHSLLYHRGRPYFYAFDILQWNGQDLRSLPLIARKQHLRELIPNRLSPLLYVDHIEERGEDLFQLACREDLEGIVAKRKDGPYDPRVSWVKIKNPAYSQIVGRNEVFEKRSA
jgi:bifunctional non-homologous end joining protein LigD